MASQPDQAVRSENGPADGQEIEPPWTLVQTRRQKRNDKFKQPPAAVIPARRHPATYSFPRSPSKGCQTVLFRPIVVSFSFNSVSQRELLSAMEKMPQFAGTWRFIRRGGLAIDFLPHTDLTNILKKNTFLGQSIQASLPGKQENLRRTIRLPPDVLNKLTSENIASLYSKHDSNPPITSIRRMGRTALLLLQFVQSPATLSITFDNQRYSLDYYYAAPLRCKRCQRFNHHSNDCRSGVVCLNCGCRAEHENCHRGPACANCGGPHSADFPHCSHKQFFLGVAKLQASRGLSRTEAWATEAKAWLPDQSQTRRSQFPPSPSISSSPVTSLQQDLVSSPPLPPRKGRSVGTQTKKCSVSDGLHTASDAFTDMTGFGEFLSDTVDQPMFCEAEDAPADSPDVSPLSAVLSNVGPPESSTFSPHFLRSSARSRENPVVPLPSPGSGNSMSLSMAAIIEKIGQADFRERTTMAPQIITYFKPQIEATIMALANKSQVPELGGFIRGLLSSY